MAWINPTPGLIQELRSRDGQLYHIGQEFLNQLQLEDSTGSLYFPIYTLDGSLVGWTVKDPKIKKWSQQILRDIQPRFTTYHPGVIQAIHATRKICLVEGSYDMLAVAPAIPWVISTNTSRVAQEVLEWIKDWQLHTFTAFDYDTPNPKTGQTPGQSATRRITDDLRSAGNQVTNLNWDQRYKDPGQAYACQGHLFHRNLASQVAGACSILK